MVGADQGERLPRPQGRRRVDREPAPAQVGDGHRRRARGPLQGPDDTAVGDHHQHRPGTGGWSATSSTAPITRRSNGTRPSPPGVVGNRPPNHSACCPGQRFSISGLVRPLQSPTSYSPRSARAITGPRPRASAMIWPVRRARTRSDVTTPVTPVPCSRSAASAACASPSGDSGGLAWPCHRPQGVPRRLAVAHQGETGDRASAASDPAVIRHPPVLAGGCGRVKVGPGGVPPAGGGSRCPAPPVRGLGEEAAIQVSAGSGHRLSAYLTRWGRGRRRATCVGACARLPSESIASTQINGLAGVSQVADRSPATGRRRRTCPATRPPRPAGG